MRLVVELRVLEPNLGNIRRLERDRPRVGLLRRFFVAEIVALDAGVPGFRLEEELVRECLIFLDGRCDGRIAFDGPGLLAWEGPRGADFHIQDACFPFDDRCGDHRLDPGAEFLGLKSMRHVYLGWLTFRGGDRNFKGMAALAMVLVVDRREVSAVAARP